MPGSHLKSQAAFRSPIYQALHRSSLAGTASDQRSMRHGRKAGLHLSTSHSRRSFQFRPTMEMQIRLLAHTFARMMEDALKCEEETAVDTDRYGSSALLLAFNCSGEAAAVLLKTRPS